MAAWLDRHSRFVLHFTPTSASWLSPVERFFAQITERLLRRSAFRSVADREAAITGYLGHHHQAPKPFLWTASADLILGRVQRLL